MNYFVAEYVQAATMVAAEAGAYTAAAAQDPMLAGRIATADTTRWGGITDVRKLRSMQPFLPELPEARAYEIYLQIREAERWWASPSLTAEGYGEGVAQHDDEIRVARGNGAVVMGADHATDPVRKATGIRENADHGTAGLAVVLANEGLVDAVIPVGRQMGNANVDLASPYKQCLRDELRRTAVPRLGFVSLHGKVPGHVTGVLEQIEIHAFLGLGKYPPNEATMTAAERIMAMARDELGLRVAVANSTPFLLYQKYSSWQPGMSIRDKTDLLVMDSETGLPKVNFPDAKLAALGDGTTTNFVNGFIEANPDYPRIPVMQVEMSRSLRLTPQNRFNRDPKAMAMGVYLGYLLNRRIVEICRKAGQSVTLSA